MSTPTAQRKTVDLAITGMTCASCVSHVEGALHKLDGVSATVNLATRRARVKHDGQHDVGDLIAAVATTGYTASPTSTRGLAADSTGQKQTDDARLGDRALRLRALVASLLAVVVLLVAMVPSIREATGAANPWLQLALTTPVYFWAAWPFHRAAAVNARHGASTMTTLVSIGITAAYGWSLVVTLTGSAGSDSTGSAGHLYFQTAAIVTALLLIGRYIESRATAAGRSALTSLVELGAKDVAVLRHDPRSGAWREERVDAARLDVGMRFVTRPGEKVATDGRIIDGRSAIDASLVTGESTPIDVEAGDEVTGATLNTHGRIIIQATRVGADTTLAQITALVEEAQTGLPPVQRLANRVLAVFVPAVLIIAALTLLGWLLSGHDLGTSIEPTVAVLIIACPCAIGLAAPTALLTGTGRGARLGILIKGPQILESTRRVDTVVLDKTGTITTGQATLTDLTVVGRLSPDAALTAAACVEQGSEHPIARAIVQAAQDRLLQVPPVEDFVNLRGAGVRGRIKTTEVSVGRPNLFDHVPDALHTALAGPGTTVLVGWGGHARAALTVADEVRATSRVAIQRLGHLGLVPHLVTGDDAQTAHSVAEAVGIDSEHLSAGVSPADKHAEVTELQRAGRAVVMVGDGVSDAAALAAADLGIAMGGGTDVAIESADIVLMRCDLGAVATAIALSRQTLRVIKQNLGWAFGYNIAAIPLAAFGLLNPMIAGAVMAASSILVVLNSLRLRNFEG
ncbi:MAG: heavy metal translocating P-type ATPase [Ornithinimicrobium sp.]